MFALFMVLCVICILCLRIRACNFYTSCPFLSLDDVCENYVVSVYVDGYGGLSKIRLCVFCELCSVSFLVVGECLSVLL